MTTTLSRLNSYAALAIRIVIAGIAVALLGVHPVMDRYVAAGRELRQARADDDHSRAARAYRMLYEIQPWAPEHLDSALAAEMRAGEFDAAERDLNAIAARRPLDAQELAWLGTIYATKGNTQQAAQTWEQARALGTLDTSALGDLADLYMQQGNWQGAAAVLETLTQLQPTDAGLLVQLGMLQALDKPDQAAVTLGQAATVSPELAPSIAPLRASLDARLTQTPDYAFAALGAVYLRLNHYPLAEEAFARAVAYNPAYPDALAYLGYVRARLDKPALAPVQQAIALAPDSPSVHIIAGLTWSELGRPADARTELETAYDLDPQNPSICVEIANTYRAEGGLLWAEIWMQEAVRLAPGDPRFRVLLVQFYVDENYNVAETGLELAKQLVADLPDNAEAHDALAWAYFLTQDFDAAQAELDRAMTLDPNLPRAYIHMGQVMEQRGQFDHALWYYIRTRDLDAGGPFAALAQRAIDRLGGG
jgi:tetratricopeptide (TPR) repeat protein